MAWQTTQQRQHVVVVMTSLEKLLTYLLYHSQLQCHQYIVQAPGEAREQFLGLFRKLLSLTFLMSFDATNFYFHTAMTPMHYTNKRPITNNQTNPPSTIP